MKDYLSGNKNIVVDHKAKLIQLQPYNTELTPKSIKSMLQQVISEIEDFDYSVDLGGDHNFNGLFETNVSLLNQGGDIICNYTGKSVTL